MNPRNIVLLTVRTLTRWVTHVSHVKTCSWHGQWDPLKSLCLKVGHWVGCVTECRGSSIQSSNHESREVRVHVIMPILIRIGPWHREDSQHFLDFTFPIQFMSRVFSAAGLHSVLSIMSHYVLSIMISGAHLLESLTVKLSLDLHFF